MPLVFLLELIVLYLTYVLQGLAVVLLLIAAANRSLSNVVLACVVFWFAGLLRRAECENED